MCEYNWNVIDVGPPPGCWWRNFFTEISIRRPKQRSLRSRLDSGFEKIWPAAETLYAPLEYFGFPKRVGGETYSNTYDVLRAR